MIANVNSYMHRPITQKVDRQLPLGAAAVKISLIHGSFAPNDPLVYPHVRALLSADVPVILHSRIRMFPGTSSSFADPTLVEDMARNFLSVKIALAAGGRG